ncbi:MAG: glycine zipper domain-containing protein [Asticcacaulis sp.]
MISTATKTAAGLTEKLAEHDVKHDLKEKVAELQERGAEILGNASDYANEAGVKVRHFVDRTADDLGNVTQNVETEIRGNPVRSAMIALGVGFVIGALLARR